MNYDDINISIKSIEENITKKTKAIIPVHFAGKSCNMSAMKKLAKKNNLEIVEDCAHALGSKYKKLDGKFWIQKVILKKYLKSN